MELLRHWNLKERPFEATWDTRFFYGSPNHLEALNRLIYLVEERTMNACLLSGEIGCGKTLTRAAFTQHIDNQRFNVVTLENSGFCFEDLLLAILRKLDPQHSYVGTSKFERCERLSQLLEENLAIGRHVVIILDEAQDLSSETLHELRWLTNFNAGGRSYLTLLLIGQPELRKTVVTLPALDQRISLRFHLKPLSHADIGGYVAHRLRVAGHPTGQVFTEDACRYLYTASGGVPREVNRLAKLALEYVWLRNGHLVDTAGIDAVVKDLERHQTLRAA